MLIRHSPEAGFGAGEDFDTNAWYVHLGYRLPPAMYGLRPYVRLEKIEADDPHPLGFFPTLAYDAIVAGIRWDFSSYAALKAEYRDEDLPTDEGWSVLLNASFVIPNLLGGGSAAGH